MLHTGDFKMDQFPLDNRITDLRGFARLGEEGVDLFLTDSTNAEVPGFTLSEGDLVGDRDGVPQGAEARHRVQLRQPRAPHPAGARRRARPRPQGRLRGTVDGPNMGIARDLGYLNVPKGLVVDMKVLEKLPASRCA